MFVNAVSAISPTGCGRSSCLLNGCLILPKGHFAHPFCAVSAWFKRVLSLARVTAMSKHRPASKRERGRATHGGV